METFRPLRRAGQALTREACEKILTGSATGVLALLGDGGYPYAVPLNFVYSAGSIYFHGAGQGHRAEAAQREGKASFCVISKDQVDPEAYATRFESVIVFGRMEVLSGAERMEALRMLTRKYVPIHSEARREAQIRLEEPGAMVTVLRIEHMTGKRAKQLADEARGETE